MKEQQKIPKQVTDILNTHNQDGDGYAECRRLVDQLEKVGWTAEWGLSGELYDLKRINS